MAAHSKIGASSMHRWARCPGSVRLCEGLPEVSSPYAAEGTKAHELLERWLLKLKKPMVDGFLSEYPPDMVEHIRGVVESIMSDVDSTHHPKDFLACETRFDLSHLYPGMFGTGDVIIYHFEIQLLRVLDLKYGQGHAVEIFEDGKPNEQLMYYALGAVEKFKLPVRTVELGILQPRIDHPDGTDRRVQVSILDVVDFAADLVDAARATDAPDAPLVPGEHCGFCKAKGFCPALHEKSLVAAQQAFAPATQYDPVKLAETLDKLSMVEKWASGVREFAYQEAMRGNPIPGYKLVEKRAHRKWKDESEAVSRLKERGMSEGFMFEAPSLKSVAQIEQAMGKKIFKNEVADLVIQESSGLTLVHENDKRPAYQKDPSAGFDALPKPTIFD